MDWFRAVGSACVAGLMVIFIQAEVFAAEGHGRGMQVGLAESGNAVENAERKRLMQQTDRLSNMDRSGKRVSGPAGAASDSVEEWNVGWGARLQFQAYGTDSDGESDVDLGAELRRLRIRIFGSMPAYNMEFNIQPSFDRGSAGLQMGYVEWKPVTTTSLTAGQFKLPATRQFMISSGRLQLVDRSFADALHRLKYDVGLMVRQQLLSGNSVLFQVYGAMTTGEGRSRPAAEGGYNYTLRTELLPFGDFDQYRVSDVSRQNQWRLSVAGTYNYNNDAVLTGGNIGESMGGTHSDIATAYGDLLLKYGGWSFFSQLSVREARPPFNVPNRVGDEVVSEGTAFLVQSGYMVSDATELAGRFAMYEPSSDVDYLLSGGRRYSLGLTRFIRSDRLKVQCDVTWIDGGYISEGSRLMVRGQIQMDF